jgi:hypothetical protein
MSSEDSIVGVFLTTTGPSPPLGDPSYDIMYRARAVFDIDCCESYRGVITDNPPY